MTASQPPAHSWQSWAIATQQSRYTLLRRAGRGSYGDVVSARDTATGELVAIKRVAHLFGGSFECSLRIFREVFLLRRLRHRNIVPLRALWVEPGAEESFRELYLIFPLMETDLSRVLRDATQPLSVDHVRYFMQQAVSATALMHAAGVLHRDIKPANFLLNDDCTLCVCDFGLSASVYEEVGGAACEHSPARGGGGGGGIASGDDGGSGGSSLSGNGGGSGGGSQQQLHRRVLTCHVCTRWYRAPELMLEVDGLYDEKVDAWSLGCVLAELLAALPGAGGAGRAAPAGALFPGASGPPLSPARSAGGGDSAAPGGGGTALAESRRTQLNAICSVLGTPRPDDARLRSEAARAALRAAPAWPAADLAARFASAPPEALALLRGLLAFFPEDRLGAEAALDAPFLAAGRGGDGGAAARAAARAAPLLLPGATPGNIRALYLEEMAAAAAEAAAESTPATALPAEAEAPPPALRREVGGGRDSGGGGDALQQPASATSAAAAAAVGAGGSAVALAGGGGSGAAAPARPPGALADASPLPGRRSGP